MAIPSLRTRRSLVLALVVAVVGAAGLWTVLGNDGPGATLRVDAPAGAVVGEPLHLGLSLDVRGTEVAGFDVVATVVSDGVVLDGATAANREARRDLSSRPGPGSAVLAAALTEPRAGAVDLGHVVVVPAAAGSQEIRIGTLTAVDADGTTIPVHGDDLVVTLDVVDGDEPASAALVRELAAAAATAPATDTPTAPPAGELAAVDPELVDPELAEPVLVDPELIDPVASQGEPTFDVRDALEVRLAYRDTQIGDDACGAAATGLDLDGNGCVDIADVVLAERRAGTTGAPGTTASAVGDPVTFVVNSTGDGNDADHGDGICATPFGQCSLRAALVEANLADGPVTVAFDIPGTAPHGIVIKSDLPTINNMAAPILIDGYTQPGAAANTDPDVSDAVIAIEVIGDGNAFRDAFRIVSPDNVIRGLSIYDVRRPVRIFGEFATGNQVLGSFVGTDSTGTFVHPFVDGILHGVTIEEDAADNIVGTPAVEDRNVISGNGTHGVAVFHTHSDRTIIQNNIIGLNPDGTAALPNGKNGVDINFGSSDNVIGGLLAGEGNVVSGNSSTGIEVSHTADTTTNLVQGNRIGTAVDGMTTPGHTGNGFAGVYIEDGVTDNIVEYNVIGGNAVGGIAIFNGGANGISQGNVVRHNQIGRTTAGTSIPNTGNGVEVNGDDNVVGPGNLIADNTANGIIVRESDADGNTFTDNVITGNGGLGIDLAPTSPTGTINPNDVDDVDTGANDKLNFPEFTRATDQILEGTACADCTVEIFTSDETRTHGSGDGLVLVLTALSDGTFALKDHGLAIDTVLTATATDLAGNTSEFSENTTLVEHSDPPTVTVDQIDPVVDEGDTLELSATGTDPDDDPLTYDWDLDGDGEFETLGQVVTFDATDLDGPDTATVSVRATDDTGLFATADVGIVVDNVEPTATLDAPTEVDEAAGFLVSLVDVTDPSAADTAAGIRYALSCEGDPLDTIDYATASTVSSTTCTVPDGPFTQTVSGRVLDDDGGSTFFSTTVEVLNVAPSVSITEAPITVPEGSAADFAAEASDPSAADEAAGIDLDWTADVDGAGPTAIGSGPTASATFDDDATVVTEVTATDNAGDSSTDQVTVTVTNVAPDATATAETTVDEGITADISFTDIVDPSAADLAAGIRFHVNCDGASVADIYYAIASTDTEWTCFWDDGLTTHRIRYLIIDDDGGRTARNMFVTTGDNQPPTLDAPGSVSVDEGDSVLVTATATDPEGGDVEIAWDVDGDGTFETIGTEITVDAADLDGPTSFDIDLQATDPEGATTADTVTVDVVNVAPSATAPAAIDVDEQTDVVVTLTEAIDPAPADAATLRYAFSCTGASLTGVAWADASPDPTITCAGSDGPGTYDVRARVLDDDGAGTSYVVPVTVANVAPTATITPSITDGFEGDEITFTIEATDPSDDDTTAGIGLAWEVLVDGTLVASGSGTSGAFTTTDDGIVTISVTATDKDGGSSTTTADVTIANLDPVASFEGAAEASEGDSVTFTFLEVSDEADDLAAGIRFAFSCDGADLSDATWETATDTPGVLCQFADDGTFTVTGVALDDDGGATFASIDVTVANVAPQVVFSAPVEARLGGTVTLSVFDVLDPGASDTHTFRYDCGDGAGFGEPTTDTAVDCVIGTVPTQGVAVEVADDAAATHASSLLVVVHENLLVNGGFEDDVDANGEPDGWSWHRNATVSSDAATGAAAAELTADDDWRFAYLYQVVPVTARARHDVGFRVQADGEELSVVSRVRYYDDEGTNFQTYNLPVVDTPTGGEWIDVGRVDNVPPGAVSMRLEYHLMVEEGTILIDDAGTFRTNQLDNPGFETDANSDGWPDAWTRLSRFGQTTDAFTEGSFGAEFVGDGSTFVPSQFLHTVTEGETYHVSTRVWLPADVDPATVLRIQVRWYDSSTALSPVPLVAKQVGPSDGWVQLYGEVTAPASAVGARLEYKWINLAATAYADQALFTAR